MSKRKTHLELSKANGILAAVVDARKTGQFVRANTWSANGDTKDIKTDRRKTRNELRNFI